MATYEVLEAQIERYPDIGDTVEALADFSAGAPMVDYAGRLLLNDKGEAVMRFAVADGLEHALYYSYAERMWDFCRHFKRDAETGRICRID